MGILPGHLHVLAMEHQKHKRIFGDVLTLGEQAIYATLAEVKDIFQGHNITVKELPSDLNTSNKIPAWKESVYDKNTNAQAVLMLLGAEKVFSMDVNDYENPDFVFDLNEKVSDEFKERFEVVFDCGTLEHVFNIPQAFKNICRMVKPGGSIILMNPASNAIDHGFYSFSPSLFYDFFNQNGFSDFRCYLKEVNNFNYVKAGRLYRYNNVGSEYPLDSGNGMHACFFGKKTRSLNEDEFKVPSQNIYPEYYWNKEKYGKGFFKTSKSRQALKYIELVTEKFRPVWVDKLVKLKKRRRNLEYLGRF